MKKKIPLFVNSFIDIVRDDRFHLVRHPNRTRTRYRKNHRSNHISAITSCYLRIEQALEKIHKPDCGTGDLIAPKNRATYTGTIDELIEKGYTTCGNCFR